MRYKRNQVEEAIFRTLGARDARIDELKFRLKRLLVTDRRLGRDADSDEEGDRHYAFYSQDPPGSGTEVMFSGYEAFALLGRERRDTMKLAVRLAEGATSCDPTGRHRLRWQHRLGMFSLLRQLHRLKSA
jgi:hypothetical protein